MTFRCSLLAAVAASACSLAFAAAAQTPTAQPPVTSAAPTSQTPATPAPDTSAPASAATPFSPVTPAPGQDIVAVLTASGQFTTLLKAATATGLAPVLKTPGVTVFAPTDAAFAALPADQLAQMMTPAGLPQLQKALAYHVVNTKLTLASAKGKVSKIATAAGSDIYVDGNGDPLKVNDATVLQPDVAASNGEIYVIDKIVAPGFTPPTPAVDATPAATETSTKTTTTKSTTKKRR